jgi:hypothetical protein
LIPIPVLRNPIIITMSSDEIVWQVINQQFCSFKLRFVLPAHQK